MSRNMKDSGVRWLGAIPDSWEFVPIRRAMRFVNEVNNPVKFTNILSLIKDKGVIKYEDKGAVGNNRKEDLTKYKLAYQGTIVVNSMNAKIGSVGISNFDGCVSPVYYVLSPREGFDISYLGYVFETREYQKYIGSFGKGILEIREKISPTDLQKTIIPYPTIEEQIRIAYFLDKKCKIIDDEIEKNIIMIRNLNTLYSLVIDDIFSSLDCSRKKLKNVVKLRSKNAKDVKTDNYIGLENILKFKGKFVETDTKEKKVNGKFFCKGDLLINKLRPYLTKSLLAPFDGVCSSELTVVGDFHGEIKYLFYYTLSPQFIDKVNKSTYGTKMPRASWDFIRELEIPIPELGEQKEIVDKIYNETEAIDKIIELRTEMILRLEEYKKSLIYEAVTGKIEV